jgi:hypothetical protein
MMTIVLAIIAGYIAIGIAVVVTLNSAFVMPESRLRKVSHSVPLVLAWPAVLFIVWVMRDWRLW